MILKIQLQRKLDLAGRALEEQRGPRAGDRRHRRVADRRVGVIELRGIQHVEALGTELEAAAGALIEGKVLEEGQVELRRPGAKQNVSSRISEGVAAGRNKIGGIKPLLNRAIGNGSRPYAVRPLRRAAGIQQTAHHNRCERRAFFENVSMLFNRQPPTRVWSGPLALLTNF